VAKIYSNTIEDQKDLYQEIVYQLWKSFGSFKGNSKISTWIYRVALNTSVSQLKSDKRRISQTSIDIVLLNRIDEVDTALEENISIMYAQIQHLTLIEKGLILLYLEGKNYDEISNITGFTATNIGTRLSRIKKKLKTQIQK
jgi:RNA polymerase sigma-70 factor (ECF subfamily)